MFSHVTLKHHAKFCENVEENSITRCVFRTQKSMVVYLTEKATFSRFCKKLHLSVTYPDIFCEYQFLKEVGGGKLTETQKDYRCDLQRIVFSFKVKLSPSKRV